MWFGSLLRQKDILPESLPPTWDAANPQNSLERLRTYVESEAQKAIGWYFASKRSKALISRWLRLIAIVLSTAAAILPIIFSIWKTTVPGIESGLLVSLLLGLAAGIVGFDHFFGFSSGWIRYVLTASAIEAALEEFRLDWQLLLAHLSTPSTNEQTFAMIERAKNFRISITNMVQDETKAWAAEFQSNLAQLENDVKASFEQERSKVEANIKARTLAARPGAIEVKVPGALTADGRAFTISLEGVNIDALSERIEGAIDWSKNSVVPGQYKVSVKAARSGVSIQASKIVKVEPGLVTSVEIQLPS
jgi:hypothetical protein